MKHTINHLYHLAEASNLASIRKNGLMSTEKLLRLSGLTKRERTTLFRDHRPECVQLPTGVVIRDQAPMPPSALAQALDDGLEPTDWYALLNGFVFLWPDKDRMMRQRGACRDRPQVLLTFDSKTLMDEFGASAFTSAINTGNARRKPARRGHATFVPYATWLSDGWPTGQRSRPPAEFLFRCIIPVRAPYLIDITKV